ncbi:MAG: hypothetical protein ABIY70_08600, partial [Capsulimonas sp.]|uniref:hypothetical protein n=1 Tax=Capsulimonas sp. TaxID=2494211 RepID=UPI003267AB1C
MNIGDQIIYAREDSGADFPVLGLFLAPGEPLTVGEDLSEQLADRFVEEGVCRPYTAEPSVPEAASREADPPPAAVKPGKAG